MDFVSLVSPSYAYVWQDEKWLPGCAVRIFKPSDSSGMQSATDGKADKAALLQHHFVKGHQRLASLHVFCMYCNLATVLWFHVLVAFDHRGWFTTNFLSCSILEYVSSSSSGFQEQRDLPGWTVQMAACVPGSIAPWLQVSFWYGVCNKTHGCQPHQLPTYPHTKLLLDEFVDFCCEVESTASQAVVSGVCSSMMASKTTTVFSYIDLVLGFTDGASQMRKLTIQADHTYIYIYIYMMYMCCAKQSANWMHHTPQICQHCKSTCTGLQGDDGEGVQITGQ